MGEKLAAEYLMKKGYAVLCRNLHIGHLELDIVAENETHLLFVEVKTRTDTGISRYGRPSSAVDGKKKQHLLAAANAYLREHHTEKQPRLDVLEVYLCRRNELITLSPKGILHIENIMI